VLMMSLGIIGYYISKIYDEVKGRPRYIIGDITDNLHIPAASEESRPD
jgi:hypothetical protein